VAGLHGLERMADLHGSSQQKAPAGPGGIPNAGEK
jgi:hypothetical protein